MNGPETDQKRKYEQILKDIIENDVVLIPFYPEPSDQVQFMTTPMLVELQAKTHSATLYERKRDRKPPNSSQGPEEEMPDPIERTADKLSEEVEKLFTNIALY